VRVAARRASTTPSHRQLESEGQPCHDTDVGLGLDAIEVVDDGKTYGHKARPVVLGKAQSGREVEGVATGVRGVSLLASAMFRSEAFFCSRDLARRASSMHQHVGAQEKRDVEREVAVYQISAHIEGPVGTW
jgi:hypothetical protein